MLFHWSLDPLSLILDFHCFIWSLYLEVSSILVILVVLGSLIPISLMFCLWFRWILYLWSWLLLLLDFHCFVWSLYLEVSSILVILVVLGSLTPISLMFCLWFRWILYLWSWLLLLLDFHCFVWSLLVSWGIFNFGCFGCVLGSLTPISLMFCLWFR